MASGNDLIIKNQWDGVESTCSPDSELIFFMKSRDNRLKMKFEIWSPCLIKKPTVTEITNKPMIFGILEDDKGNIWFGADGVYRYDGNTITDFKSKESQE